MVKEKLTREEAIQKLTKRLDEFTDAKNDGELNLALSMLEYAGDEVGYAPAFRCLVKGLSPEDSIRWGK